MANQRTNGKAPTLVVLQMAGANDYLNTVIPYSNPLYYDNRPTVHIPEDQVLHIDDQLGFHPNMRTVKRLYDEGEKSLSSTASAIPTPITHTSAPPTSGIPASRRRSRRRVGWAKPSAISTPRARMC